MRVSCAQSPSCDVPSPGDQLASVSRCCSTRPPPPRPGSSVRHVTGPFWWSRRWPLNTGSGSQTAGRGLGR